GRGRARRRPTQDRPGAGTSGRSRAADIARAAGIARGTGVAGGTGVARGTKAGEDLAADGIVPVAERRATRHWIHGERAAAQHFVGAAEERLRVLAVRPGGEARVGQEVARCPLPHVANELARAGGGLARGI